ncbi:MAG TPA: LamG-like jellyroll fold domain-containing protein [Pyrinomonadaceae bacterium]|nr:LamG-like jellyroll fold domain-containing protein [Pyrinomonadaceae bacterium]
MKRILGPVLSLCILVLVIALSVLYLTVSSEAAPAAASSLVGEWRFDEASGTSAADSSGRSLNSTLQNGPVWASGRYRSGLRFDGVNDYVQVGAPPALVMTNAMSISAWIYPTGAGSAGLGMIVNKEGEYEIARFSDGTIRWAFANSAPGWTFIDTGFVAPLNQWTHIAVTYNNGQVKSYANGNLVQTYLGSGPIGDATTSQNDFRIGGRQYVDQTFMGLIDEVSVYNQPLTAADVSKLATGSMQRNLALGKPATQSSTGWDSPATRAVDGNTNGDWYQGSVSHTDDNYQAWWQVDLGSVQQIDDVDVWMMTICCSSHDKFDVKVSSDGSNWTSYYVAGPIDQVTVPVNRAARYVRVQLREGGYLALAEVQVWGLPGAVMPGVVQAEDFDDGGEGISYHDLTAANEGGSYRSTAVDISSCVANNYVIGWNGSGEWTQYSINVLNSGSYTFQAVIGEESTGSLHVEIDGVDRTGPITIPNTGSWCALQTISKTGISLTSGQHTVRVVTDNVGVVLDSFRLVAESSAPSNQLPNTNAGGPYSVITATPLQFSGAASYDTDGSISTYAWNFGDGQSGTGVSPSHAYTASGVYTVTLTVTDNAGGSGNASTSVTVVSPPVAPSALTATAPSASQISLSWIDNSSNEIAFLIERTTPAGGSYTTVATVGPNSTGWRDTGLSAGVNYLYRVRSAIAAGYSAYSNVASATTYAAPALDARYSLSLNGTNSYVTVPNSTTLNISGPITVEAWIKTTSTASQSIVERYNWLNTDDGGYALRLEQGRLLFGTVRNSTTYDSVMGGTPVSLNVWHHVAGIFDGSQLRVYLDGREDGVKASTVAPASGTQSLKIGAGGNDAGTNFNGLIDEVRISSGVQYRGSFTAMSLHDAGDVITDPNGGQKALWAFDTATANDDTGNGNNGTLVGSAVITTVTMAQNVKYENLMASSSSAAAADRQVVIGFDEFVNKKLADQYPDAKFKGLSIIDNREYFTFATNWLPHHGETGARLTRMSDAAINAQQTTIFGRYANFQVEFPVPASNISFEGIGVDNFYTSLTPCAAAAWLDIYFTTNPNEIPFRMPLCGRNFGVDPPDRPLLYDLNRNGIRNARKLIFHSILDTPDGIDFDTFKFTVPAPPTVTIADNKNADGLNPRVPNNLGGTVQKALIGSQVNLKASGNSAGGRYLWEFTGPVEVQGRVDADVVRFTTRDDSSGTPKQVYTVTAKVTFTDSAGATAQATVTINVHAPTLPEFSGTPGQSTVEMDPNTIDEEDSSERFVLWQMGSSDPNNRQAAMTFKARASIPEGPYLTVLSESKIFFQQAINMKRKVRDSWGRVSCKTSRPSEDELPATIREGWRDDNDRMFRNYFNADKDFNAADNRSGPGARSLRINLAEGVEGFRFRLDDVDAALVDDRYETYVMYESGNYNRRLGSVEWRWSGTLVFDTTPTEQTRREYPPFAPESAVYKKTNHGLTTGGTKPQTDTVSKTVVAGSVTQYVWQACPNVVDRPTRFRVVDNQHFYVYNLYLNPLQRNPNFTTGDFNIFDPWLDLSDTERDRRGWYFWSSNITQEAFNENAIASKRARVGNAFLLSRDPALVQQFPDLAGDLHTDRFNRAFLMACYKTFLRRRPDDPPDRNMDGFNFWLGIMNGKNNRTDDSAYFEMVAAFLESPEYSSINEQDREDEIDENFNNPAQDPPQPPDPQPQ